MLKNNRNNNKNNSNNNINCNNNQKSDNIPVPDNKKDLDFSNSKSLISHRTPVLFCTDRGLHLKTIKCWSSVPDDKDNYKIQFCDLERWNTNKANTVSLKDDEINIPSSHVNEMRDLNRLRSVRFVMEKGEWRKVYSSSRCNLKEFEEE